MIDLHTHTKYSDGTWSVEKLLQEAENLILEIISITDHDTLKAYNKLNTIDYKSIYSGKIIPGIELNTVYNKVKFELLAYGFDIDKLNKWVHENYELKKPDLKVEFDYMYKNCKAHNLKIDKIDYDIKNGWPVDVIFKEIKKHEENRIYFTDEEWNNINVFYNSSITNQDFPTYVDFSIYYPTADVVAKKVRECGGKLFIAHAYRYRLNDVTSFIDMLIRDNIIDGVEVYHSTFSKNESKILEEYCKKNNLLMSGGSDCHGDRKSERKLGIGYGNLNIKNSILDNWNIDETYV